MAQLRRLRRVGVPLSGPSATLRGPTPANGEQSAYRVVVTGGPGAGKSTAADLFRREIGSRVVVVPETATMLFTGGFPRPDVDDGPAAKAAQRAIYHTQRGVEDIHAADYPDRVLLCDRGTVDGGAYWPHGADDFFASVGSSHEAELARYDAVLFFETAALGHRGFESENRFRIESQDQAIDLDRRLRDLWSPHSRYFVIRHEASFLQKMNVALAVLQRLVDEFDDQS